MPRLGGMLATRQGALVLAVVCAASAAAVLMFALSSYKSNVHVAVAPPAQATVLVATGTIQKGTSGNQIATNKLYQSVPMVASRITPGAISDATQLKGELAQSDILPGQQLTTTDFAASASVVTYLGPNERAVSVPADEVHGDLDVLTTGARVDLYAEVSGKSGASIGVLDPGVLVLKMPGSVALGAVATVAPKAAAGAAAAAPAPSGGALVFRVSTSIAPLLMLTADNGKLWLALRPPNATNPPGVITSGQSILAQAAAANTSTSTTTKAAKHG